MAIESEVEVLKNVVSKLDTSIEKISQVSSDIGKLLAVHEQRIEQLEKTDIRRIEDIKEINARVAISHRELIDKIDILEEKIHSRINAATESRSAHHDKMETNIMHELKVLEDRLGILEKWKWTVIGGSVVIGYILNVFIK